MPASKKKKVVKKKTFELKKPKKKLAKKVKAIVKAIIKKITAWSYSRHSTYRQCPLKIKLSALDKIKEPPSKPMARGAAIHKLAENFIKGNIPKLPTELKLFSAEFKMLKARFKKKLKAMIVEDNWAFTKNWVQTGWFDKDCWVRVKLDCAHEIKNEVLIITDWKTGKFRTDNVEDYTEQLSLYALAALALYPHLKEVRPRLVYLDYGIIYPEPDDPIIYKPEDVPGLKAYWSDATRALLNDTKFAPKPNRFCSWCHYRADNKANGGGQCRY